MPLASDQWACRRAWISRYCLSDIAGVRYAASEKSISAIDLACQPDGNRGSPRACSMTSIEELAISPSSVDEILACNDHWKHALAEQPHRRLGRCQRDVVEVHLQRGDLEPAHLALVRRDGVQDALRRAHPGGAFFDLRR